MLGAGPKTKTTNKNVKIICCDNGVENKTLEDNFAKNSEGINFEITSPGTPQQTFVVEGGVASLYSRMIAIIAHAGLHKILKTAL